MRNNNSAQTPTRGVKLAHINSLALTQHPSTSSISLGKCASFAFTMAEILLSLTIIGVVAAITLPSLTGNINERTWSTQRKALFSRMSQAVALMDGVRGYGTINTISSPDAYGFGGEYYTPNGAETFLTSGLSKVLKTNNICDSSHISDCGMPDQITNLVGSKVNVSSMTNLIGLHNAFAEDLGCGVAIKVDGPSAAFETQNGESLLTFYNPICKNFESVTSGQYGYGYTSQMTCANFVYDLNGKKGPNTVGKDVGFITVFYPNDSVVVAPIPAVKNVSDNADWYNAGKLCTSSGDNYRVPNKEELVSLYINNKFIDGTSFDGSKGYFSSSLADNNYAWLLGTSFPPNMALLKYNKTYKTSIRCIKR